MSYKSEMSELSVMSLIGYLCAYVGYIPYVRFMPINNLCPKYQDISGYRTCDTLYPDMSLLSEMSILSVW